MPMTNPGRPYHVCFFCDLIYSSVPKLVAHLDQQHDGWIDYWMERNGFRSPASYPVMEYRYALAELLETLGHG